MTTPVFPTGILCAEIAGLHRQLANTYDKLAQELAHHDAKLGTSPAIDPQAEAKRQEILTNLDSAAKVESKAKKEKAKKADPPPAAEARLVDDRPKLTPEQIASRLKESIVALATKDRPKCAAIVAGYGAKKFSEIPVEKHAEALAEITAALDGKPKGEEDLLG